jgi:hypothetical protein
MSGFHGDKGDGDYKIKDLSERLKKIKKNDQNDDSKPPPNYDDLAARFTNLKQGSRPAATIPELMDRFSKLHPDICAVTDSNSDTLVDHSSTLIDEFLDELEAEKQSAVDTADVQEDVDFDDFEAFISMQISTRLKEPIPSSDISNVDNIEELLGGTDVGVSMLAPDQGNIVPTSLMKGSIPARDKTDIDVLMEQMDDEARLLGRGGHGAPTTSDSLTSSRHTSLHTSVLRSEYLDESEEIKRLLMASRDEARLESKYGTRKSTRCDDDGNGGDKEEDSSNKEKSKNKKNKQRGGARRKNSDSDSGSDSSCSSERSSSDCDSDTYYDSS